jgi:hypothetical protein
MKKFLKSKNFLLLFSALLGVFYLYLTTVKITDIDYNRKYANQFTFKVQSKINQDIKLHIATQRHKLLSVKCNEIQIDFAKKKKKWFEGLEEQLNFSLKQGENSCIATTINYQKAYKPVVKQKISYFDYGVLFILLGIPIFHLIFTFFIFFLDKVKYKPAINITQNKVETTKKIYLLFAILALGVLIRIIYFHKFGVTLFQHDWHGHIEFIKYLADNWSLPLPSKGLEYPQQPLYYLVTAGLYSLLSNFALTEKELIFGIGYISLLSSIAFLYYGYRFISLLSQSLWVQTVAMVFISLTPSIVYLSARINNDSLVMALSAFSLYYILKSYQSEFKTDFYTALLGVSLLFLTKISTASMELLLFALLVIVYLRTKEVKNKLYTFGLVGVFLLGFTLLRVYLPVESSFHMVNSSAHYPNQMIQNLDLSYFATFHINSLLNVGYSHVFGLDDIRYSFITYQYGTMFFGEFDYTHFLDKHEYLNTVMKLTLLFGLIFILGFIMFILKIRKSTLTEKLLFATLFLNFLLILKFMLTYPVICNTDFRYYVPSFVIFAFIIAKGLSYFEKINFLWKALNIVLAMLVTSEIIYFAIFLS